MRNLRNNRKTKVDDALIYAIYKGVGSNPSNNNFFFKYQVHKTDKEKAFKHSKNVWLKTFFKFILNL